MCIVNLPSEIVIEILSRLPVRTIVSCKCVCKSWLNILGTREFLKSHLSKLVPGVAFWQCKKSQSFRILEFEDGLDLERHDLHYNSVTEFSLPHHLLSIKGSANGLLLLIDDDPIRKGNTFYICNPITRDYIEIQCPQEFVDDQNHVTYGVGVSRNLVDYSINLVDCSNCVTYGFGVSRMTGQHKVVRISSHCELNPEDRTWKRTPEAVCHVYTLGTGSWRRIGPAGPVMYQIEGIGAYLNGRLHWLVYDLNHFPWISCFDLETELFSTLPAPACEDHARSLLGIFSLADCLCLCDSSYEDENAFIWLMMEYGIGKSWTKKFSIRVFFGFGKVTPVKVFKDGDLLMGSTSSLFYYSIKTGATRKVDMFAEYSCCEAILHTSSFLSLKSFGMENVSSF